MPYASMRHASRLLASLVLAFCVTFLAEAAEAGMGQPSNWQLGLQEPATSVQAWVTTFHDFLLFLITLVTLFVLALLVWVMWRYNARNNLTPSKTSHNTLVEVAWTVVPVLILFAIAIPSFRLLFYQTVLPNPEITVKATGKQWFWTYAYPDSGKLEYDSLPVDDASLKPGQPRMLATDNPLVVPVNKVVRVQVLGGDVIHAFGVPSFGVKIDAIPGRLNETWFKAEREGTYYGQCYELCGRNHAFMPIEVRVLSEQAFATWLEEAKKKFSGNEAGDAQLASAPAH